MTKGLVMTGFCEVG